MMTPGSWRPLDVTIAMVVAVPIIARAAGWLAAAPPPETPATG